MDYRLVPYIKKYLHEGHSLEQIRQSLLSQGIPDADIKQAAIYAMDEGLKDIKKKNYAVWIVPILLVLLIGGVGYYFKDHIALFATGTMNKLGGTNQHDNQAINEGQQNGMNTQQGSCDMDCLIASAETCDDANTEYHSRLDFFGMIISSTNYYEIQSGTRCKLYIKSVDGNIEFSQELREQSKANGITEEELNLQLEEARKEARATIGKDGTCVFSDTQKLKEFLEKTKTGTFSAEVSCPLEGKCIYGGDWALGECSGSMFERG